MAILGLALTTSMWADNAQPAAPAKIEAQPKRDLAVVYPYEMLIQGKTGWAEANFVIDYAGRPLFTNTSAASDPAFAKAAIAMVEANQFATCKKDKRVVMAQAVRRFSFGGEASLSPETRRFVAELRKDRPAICDVAELDQRPKAVRQSSPVYPRAMKDDGLTGQAEIEFIVTADGSVVCPRIISASQEDFGWAAAAAVAQWRFQAPTKNGKKVDARMTVPVLFDARQLAAAD